uniref:Uncharacterized protein n=1 Tax=Cacopsylla melanoneura TaxID=428564 RepID=A0A8D8Z866_9HEMI
MYCFRIIVSIILPLLSELALGRNDHYPSWRSHDKPCMRLKQTVSLVMPICIPNSTKPGENEFTKESMDNCHKLKDTCPEFNQAICTWGWWDAYKNTCSVQDKNQVKSLKIPICVVYYAARSYIWGQVMYTNQYGTSPDLVYDIIELGRTIQKYGAFPNKQPDYPENVQDPKGERGLAWNLTSGLLSTNGTVLFKAGSGLLCENLLDSKCNNQTMVFFKQNYPKGFSPYKMPENTAKENETSANVTIEITGVCDNIVIDNLVKKPACKISYFRRTKYSYHDKDNDAVQRDTRQQWLEVQIWQKSLTFDNVDNGFGTRVAAFTFEPNVDD